MKKFITILLLSASFVSAARIEDSRTSEYVDIMWKEVNGDVGGDKTEEEKIRALIGDVAYANENKPASEIINNRRKLIAAGGIDPKELMYVHNGVTQSEVTKVVSAVLNLSLAQEPVNPKTGPMNPNGPTNPNKKPVNPNTPANPNKEPVNPNGTSDLTKKPANPNKKVPSTEESLVLTEKAYRDFDPRLGDKVASIIKRGGVTADVEEGNTAYASTRAYIDEPVLGVGKPGNIYSDVSTIIHEMGHVIHMEYAREDVISSTLASKKVILPSPIQYETVGMFFELMATDSVGTPLREHLERVKGSLMLTARTVITEDAVDALPVVTEEAVDAMVEEYGGTKDRLILIPYYSSSYLFAGLLGSKLHELYLSGTVENFNDKLITLMQTSTGASLQETFAPFGIDTTSPGVWTQLAKDFEKRLLNS